ncbi:hypothetical protein T265_13257, partial [Opisthorchis viverrini]
AAAIVQGSLLGIASVLPPRNIRAFLEGQASSGVIAAVAQILSLAGSSLITTSAFAYFLVALIFLGLSTALTLALKRNEHFLYYWKAESTYQTKEEESKDRGANASGLSADTLDTLVESNGQHKTGSSPMRLLKSLGEMWVHGCCVMVTLMFTLMLFPALLQPIKSMIDDPENVWASKFFIPVIVFLSFNLFDWIGRTLAGFIKWAALTPTLDSLGIDVYCVSETRIQDASTVTELTAPSLSTRFQLRTSGDPEAATIGYVGVGIILSHGAEVSLLDWISVDSHIRSVRLATSVKEFNKLEVDRCLFIVFAYAQTDCSSDAVKDGFYDILNALLQQAKSSDTVVIAGDLNAQVEKLNVSETQLGSRYGLD